MLLTIIEIVVFMAAAAILGVVLGWVLRGTLGREQTELSELRAEIRKLKKESREKPAVSKAESAAPAAGSETKTAADKGKQAAPAKPADEAKAERKPAPKAPEKAPAKTGGKKAPRKTQAEREADLAAGKAAFAEVMERIGGDDQQDNLTKIYGIGKRYEAMLNELSITSYAQVAQLRKADLKTLAAALGVLDDRIETEDWVGSARQLAKET